MQDKFREKRLKGQDFLYGILVALSVSIIIESLFALIQTGNPIYFIVMIVSAFLTFIFYFRYKKIHSIPDLAVYKSTFTIQKKIKVKYFYNTFRDSLKDNLKQNNAGLTNILEPYKNLLNKKKKYKNIEYGFNIFKPQSAPWKNNHIRFKREKSVIETEYIIEYGGFGDKLLKSIKETLKYLYDSKNIVDKPILRNPNYHYYHFLAPKILKGEKVE